MAFEDVMGTVMPWMVGIEAAAAIAAEITLKQSGEAAPPEIAAALRAVSDAAGLGDAIDELPPPQQAVVAALVRLYLTQSLDLLDAPGRPAGWTFGDAVILDGWGRGSSMVPGVIAGGPELGDVERFLDVGTGVGLLAVTAASVWPKATIVGIDVWDPSLERARANIAQAGLEDRITLRNQDVLAIDDVDEYDCVWLPTFFFTEAQLTEVVPKLVHATRPGGRLVLGLFAPPPDPLAAAVSTLRTVRGGGIELDAKHATELLEQAGCTAVEALARPPGIPMEFIVGQKPT
jgi:precorrin-6B methylase 2